MHYTGEVYRHPMEGYTPLLEVTIGCSYNKCAFCTMYQRTPFITTKMEIIEEDLKELKAKSKGEAVKRICLVNADPFVLSTDKLIAISDLIIKYFPEIETITGYASIRNFTKKTPKDLLRLKAARFNDFHIGLESGYDPALKTINKGYTAKEARVELKKIKEAGLRWDALLMMGVAGKGNGSKNIEATAKLLNEFPPYMISLMPMSVTPGSKLEIITNRGEYVELTERELLEEEKEFLEALRFEDCYFFGSGMNFEIENYSAATENILLAVTAMGFATVWTDGILRMTKVNSSVRRILNIPQEFSIRAVLPIGKPTEKLPPHEKETIEKMVIFNRF